MKILCVNSSLASAFKELGHEVVAVHPAPGVHDAQSLLPEGLEPDLFLQQEVLGARIILKNLNEIKCCKAFWSLDTHLNIHWQKFYGQCFDIFFTPHLSFYQNMPESWRHPHMRRLAMHGFALPFTPHAERSRLSSFVGVLTDSRPVRKNIISALRKRFDLYAPCQLSFTQMMDVYRQTKILPNESIGGEINYRVTEGASAGCCLISQNIGEDLEALYEPDKEVVVFDDILELLDKIAFFGKKASLAEAVGQNAWRRTNQRHLPAHRAADIIEAFKNAAPQNMSARKHTALYCASLAQMARNGSLKIMEQGFHKVFENSLEEDDELWAAYFLYLSDFLPEKTFMDKVSEHFKEGRRPGFKTSLSLAAHALKTKNLALFTESIKTFETEPAPPDSVYNACLFLAALAEKHGLLFQPGFTVYPGKRTPETALEILSLALEYNESDVGLLEKMLRLTSRSPAYAYFSLGLMAKKNLLEGDNWRGALQYARQALICGKAEEGAAELQAARLLAQQAGQLDDFIKSGAVSK